MARFASCDLSKTQSPGRLNETIFSWEMKIEEIRVVCHFPAKARLIAPRCFTADPAISYFTAKQ